MRNLLLFAFVLLFWSCEMQTLEELGQEPETSEQLNRPNQISQVSKDKILSLGKATGKKDWLQCHRIRSDAAAIGFYL